MIVSLLIDWLFRAVASLLSFLPDDSISWPSTLGIGTTIGEIAGPADPLLPVAEFALFTELTAQTVLPIYLGYRLSFWLYDKLPFT